MADEIRPGTREWDEMLSELDEDDAARARELERTGGELREGDVGDADRLDDRVRDAESP